MPSLLPLSGAGDLPQRRVLGALVLCVAALTAACAPRRSTPQTTVEAPVTAQPQPVSTPIAVPIQTPEDPREIVRAEVARDTRTYTVSMPLLAAAIDRCPALATIDPGLLVWNDQHFGPAAEALLRQEYRLGRRLQIRALAPWMSRYPLQIGDVVTEVGGVAIPDSEAARDTYEQAVYDDLEDGVLTLTIDRGGDPRTGNVPAEAVCGITFSPLTSPLVDSQSAGDVISLSDGLYQLAADDRLLAAVMAIEMARLFQAERIAGGRQPQYLDQDQALGVPPGQSEIDLEAMGILARAGLPPDQVLAVWIAAAARPPESLGPRWQVPMTAAREAFLRQAAGSLAVAPIPSLAAR